jgi:hypothetical protein
MLHPIYFIIREEIPTENLKKNLIKSALCPEARSVTAAIQKIGPI